MLVFTLHGTYLPERIKVGPLDIGLRPFADRPLQCYRCYEFGHGKNNCTGSPRCGHCSASDAHPTSECEFEPYCFHCRDKHPLSSRQCAKYRLEQDILQLANTQFISVGSARRELSYRQKGGGVKTFASSSRSNSNIACTSSATVPKGHQSDAASHSIKKSIPTLTLSNKFSTLHEVTSDSSSVNSVESTQPIT